MCCGATPGAPDWAFEAAMAALRAAAGELPDQPVLVVTQTANHRARKLASRLGFKDHVVLGHFRHGRADHAGGWPMHEWLTRYEQAWNDRLDRMDDYLQELQRRERAR